VTAAGFESPSLGSPGGGAGPAFERKFLLDEARAQEVEAWARRRLTLDPHGDPALDGAYRTTSLYCDTPGLDVYHRTEAYKGHKFRVRRYGSAPWAFLERKSKEDDRVAKRRTPVPEEELALLAHPTPPRAWPGRWFHRRLWSYHLHPACRITYWRTAFAGYCAQGPLRLTLDRLVHGTPADEWGIAPVEGGRPLLSGQVILEFKFRTALPATFEELARDLGLSPSTVSKYRLCREAWGWPTVRREVGEA
jgi:hypothetical protein